MSVTLKPRFRYMIRQKEDADLAVLWGAAILCTDTPSDLLGIAPAE